MSADTQLELRVRINGTELTTRVVSVRGASVTLAGPQGLLIEARPSPAEANHISIQLCFYESFLGGRRQVGCSIDSSSPIVQGQEPEFVTTHASVLHGRKEWSVKARYL